MLHCKVQIIHNMAVIMSKIRSVKESSIIEISIIYNIPASKTQNIESHFHPR